MSGEKIHNENHSAARTAFQVGAVRGPGERANAELKSWKTLRKIHSSPSLATTLVNAVRTVIQAS
ncbi:hypothetical protein [Saccharopolyspora sp. NPDC002376]